MQSYRILQLHDFAKLHIIYSYLMKFQQKHFSYGDQYAEFTNILFINLYNLQIYNSGNYLLIQRVH